MTQLTHSEARGLLSRSLDAQISSGERRALDEHLAQCDACSAYAADLQRMNAHLFESLQTRWADPNLSSLEMDRSLRLTGQRVRQRSTGRRLMLVAQPAVWTLGAVALVAAMAWIISAISPTPADDIEATPTTESVSITATPASGIATTATGEAQPTRGICTAAVSTVTDLREGPNEGYLSQRTVYPGITGEVLSIYYEDPNTPWLQVYFKETATLEYLGWLLASSVEFTGDCLDINQIVPTASLEPATATTRSQSTGGGGSNSTATSVINPATDTPTWEATSTVAPETDLNDIIYVVPESPYNSASMSWTLTQSNPVKYVGVRVNNVYGDAVSLNVYLECNGGETLLDFWGVNGSSIDNDCGTTYYKQEGITQGDNFVAFKITLPADVSSLSFTIYASVEQ